jgi:hypothetical protein
MSTVAVALRLLLWWMAARWSRLASGVWTVWLAQRTDAHWCARSYPLDRPLHAPHDSKMPGLQTDATFSPDGRSKSRMLGLRAGTVDIWVQSLDGSAARQLTKSTAQETEPAWSPDGKVIVYRSERDGGGLFVVPAQAAPSDS